ncbi:hypothetical protein ACQP25_06060 [Microtetraspora malaysiensis]|uniref:hypothetical protein n=1 Tax=Microtetraspora malaysiensis TaxID=161358 RepID=UPI003D8C6960
MATFTDLVFVSERDLQSVASELRLALGVTFERRESWYRGGDYLLSSGGFGEETTSVQRNAEMDELAEPDYPHAPTLVQVEGTRRPEELEHRLGPTSLTLIRRSTWEEPDRGSAQDSEPWGSEPERPAMMRLIHAAAHRLRRRDQ